MADPTPDHAASDASDAEAASTAPDVAAGEATSTPDAAAEPLQGVSDELAETAGELAAAATAALGGGVPDEEQSAELPPDDLDLAHLPVHTRSLLRIRVPVTVTLATQRIPIHEITDLGPGSLVKFEKTYDEPLELAVGDLRIARGEAVKVGDKFGLRIGNLIKPHERFASVQRESAAQRGEPFDLPARRP